MQSWSSEEIFKEFQRFQISSSETEVFLSLLQDEGQTGYSLSKKTGVSSSKIYSVLNRLVERGFIVASDSRPVKYFPRPPKEIIDELRNELNSSFNILEQSLKAIHTKNNTNELLAWNITGRNDIIQRAKDIIEASEDSIFLATWSKELRPLRNNLLKAVDRGVKLKLVCYGQTNFDRGEIYFHRPSDYPFRERGERRFVLTGDNNRAVIANITQDKGVNGLWTENRGLVLLFKDFVIHEIYIIKFEIAYPEEVRKLFGPDWEEARLS
ncbi:MAG: hypothetical protein K9K64_12840 [Desulfohalobiaceae bacterium]|nr:hypothetical protein [Desulfohalobiaceae bacterium]